MEPPKIVIYIAIAIVLIAAVKTALPKQRQANLAYSATKHSAALTPISTIILAAIAVVLFYFSGKVA